MAQDYFCAMVVYDMVVSLEVLDQYFINAGKKKPKQYLKIQRRSVGVCQKQIKINLKVEVNDTPPTVSYVEYVSSEYDVRHPESIIIVWVGSAKIFCRIKSD